MGYKLTIPTMRIEIPQEIKDLCEDPNQGTPRYITTSFIPNFYESYAFTARFENTMDFVAISPKTWRINKDLHRGKEYIWLTSPFNYDNPYFLTANDYEFTDFDFDVTLLLTAPDLTVNDVTLSNKKLEFKIVNIGNERVIVTLDSINIKVGGCLSPECEKGNEESYYTQTIEKTELSLLPDQSRTFSITLPDRGDNGDFEKYSKFKVSIFFDTPDDFIEQNYDNNEFREVLTK
jgi:hypothetical protein